MCNELCILPDINCLTYATNVFQNFEVEGIPSYEATPGPSSSNLLSAEFQQCILSDFAQAATQHRESLDLDLRALNAFLVSMPWHSFVDSFEDRTALHQLVSVPGPREPYVNQIAMIVKDYFKTNMLKVGSQSYLLRRKIQSISGSVSL